MKEKNVTIKHLEKIREFFKKTNKSDISEVLSSIKEAEAYLTDNVEKAGLFEFSAKVMDSSIKVESPEENILANRIFSDLDSQLIGNTLTESY